MYGFNVIVEGDLACFTRPEMKVERVSYDVPPPGALEGLIKSVYWKPAIRYVIDKIIIFNPIEFMNIRRNEVSEKVLLSNVKGNMNGANRDISIYTSECRSQRASKVLKNVRYGVSFHFELTGLQDDIGGEASERKHYSILKRRLENGQHFRTPCLGCSEFPVRRITLVESFDLEEIHDLIRCEEDVDMGYMLYRMRFTDAGRPTNENWEAPVFSDSAEATYYRPHMLRGIIEVPKYLEGQVC